jgi:tetratricopeptide (TPR) repeat protein
MKQVIIKKIFAIVTLMFSVKMTAQPITVILTANYSRDVKIYHDEPLLLVVSVTNQEAQENSRWNKAADRRLNELEELLKANKISREDYDREKKKLTDWKKEISSVTIGSPQKAWSHMIRWKAVNTKSGEETILTVKILPNPSTEMVAVLNEKGYYQAYFGINPDDVRKLPDGEYDITAIMEAESSEPVHLLIQKVNMPLAIANSEAMLLKTGQYYWHNENGEKAVQYADMILAKNPASVDALSLKGDGQIQQKLYQQALETYKKATAEYYKQNGANSEPPEYLLTMIEYVKKELGQ